MAKNGIISILPKIIKNINRSFNSAEKPLMKPLVKPVVDIAEMVSKIESAKLKPYVSNINEDIVTKRK